jgi:hypothetical protein
MPSSRTKARYLRSAQVPDGLENAGRGVELGRCASGIKSRKRSQVASTSYAMQTGSHLGA